MSRGRVAKGAEVGAQHGSWTVLSGIWSKPLCRCACGTERVVQGADLRSGRSTNCGCVREVNMRQAARLAVTRHGLADTPTHRSWIEMRRRCYATHRKEFPNYGGRGIVVCDRWRNSFDNFFADMGVRPEGHTLDRIDNDGPYAPENCHWIPRAEQELNKRNNVRLTFRGETLSITEAAAKYGITEGAIRQRIGTRGWAIERALTEPLRHTRPRSR